MTLHMRDSGAVRLELVCNVGNALGTILDTAIQQGCWTVVWNGEDRDSLYAPLGRYRMRLTLSDTTLERDFTLDGLSDQYEPLNDAGPYALNMDYPNPFSAGTVISFSLADSSRVLIDLFDLNGQTVRTFADSAFIPSGNHHWVWDGRDDSGAELPSGLYFYRLSASGWTYTRKMVLLK